MKKLFEHFGIALCGLATSVVVAFADVALAHMLDFDFFTFSVGVFIPAGAVLVGCAAASGYYFGAVHFHKKADKMLLLQMVVIAGVAQFLIYWLGYVTLVLDNGIKVSTMVPFRQYIDVLFTSAHYQVGRGQTDTGAVGSFGYWIAGIQFAGFLIGGLIIYFVLRAKPVCEACDLYLGQLGRRVRNYASTDDASAYFDTLFKHPVGSKEFMLLFRSKASVAKVEQGTCQVNTVLLGCPECEMQLLKENVNVFNGKEWKELKELGRLVKLPAGTNLAPLLRN